MICGWRGVYVEQIDHFLHANGLYGDERAWFTSEEQLRRVIGRLEVLAMMECLPSDLTKGVLEGDLLSFYLPKIRNFQQKNASVVSLTEASTLSTSERIERYLGSLLRFRQGPAHTRAYTHQG